MKNMQDDRSLILFHGIIKYGSFTRQRGTRFILKIIFPLLTLAFFTGCVTHTLKPSFINSEKEFNYINKPDTKIRFSENRDELNKPYAFNIAPVKWEDRAHLYPSDQKDLGEFLRRYFYYGLLDESLNDMILLRKDDPGSYAGMQKRLGVMETSITHVRRGNGILRYFLGYGLGRTDIQVEGRVTDFHSGEEIMAFVLRRYHEGNAYGGWNFRALSNEYCLRMSLEEIALNVADLLRNTWISMAKFGSPTPFPPLSMER